MRVVCILKTVISTIESLNRNLDSFVDTKRVGRWGREQGRDLHSNVCFQVRCLFLWKGKGMAAVLGWAHLSAFCQELGIH